MSTYWKNRPRDFASPNKPDRLYTPSEGIVHDDKAPSRLGSATLGFLGPDLWPASAPALALTLLFSIIHQRDV